MTRMRKLALTGSILIVLSGLLSIVLGSVYGLWHYEPDPNELFGHIGIYPGIKAVIIGAILITLALFDGKSRRHRILAGLGFVVLGHLGAVYGAMLVGTAGVLCLYIAGFGMIIRTALQQGNKPANQVTSIPDSPL